VAGLLRELERMRDRFYDRNHDYIGEIAAPLQDGPDGLRHYLRVHDFRPLGDVWYRPRSVVDPTWAPPNPA
jgi:hypothetical protein